MSDAEMQRTLGNIEGSLAELLRRAEANDAILAKVIDRVGHLETWRSYLAGATAVTSIAIAAIYKFLTLP